MSPLTGGGGLWGRFNLKSNGPVILVGFTQDPRAHKGGVLWQSVPAVAGGEEAGRRGGREEKKPCAEEPCQLFLLITMALKIVRPRHQSMPALVCKFSGLNHTPAVFTINSECPGENIWLACGQLDGPFPCGNGKVLSASPDTKWPRGPGGNLRTNLVRK